MVGFPSASLLYESDTFFLEANAIRASDVMCCSLGVMCALVVPLELRQLCSWLSIRYTSILLLQTFSYFTST